MDKAKAQALLDELQSPKIWCCIFEHDGQVRHGATDAPFRAADLLKAFIAQSEERDRLYERLVETQMLAHKWMEAHDKLHAGKPYDFPKPADLPAEITRLNAVIAAKGEALDRLQYVVCDHCRECVENEIAALTTDAVQTEGEGP